MNIDLDPENIKLFNISRPNDLNINEAISSIEKELDLYYYHDKSAINTVSSEIYRYFLCNNYKFINWNHADLIFVNNDYI